MSTYYAQFLSYICSSELSGPARNLPEHLGKGKLNNETVPLKSLVVTGEQLGNIKLRKTETRPPYKYYVHRDERVVEFAAAGIIRSARPYKRSSSVTICNGISGFFANREEPTSLVVSSLVEETKFPENDSNYENDKEEDDSDEEIEKKEDFDFEALAREHHDCNIGSDAIEDNWTGYSIDLSDFVPLSPDSDSKSKGYLRIKDVKSASE